MERTPKADRDVGLDRIIRRRLAAERESGGAQCPDASIIAAYCERSLPLDERALWERHFAECARCAGTIAAFARIVDTVETTDSTPAASIAGDARRWWGLRGAFPLAAFSATVAIVALIVIRAFTARHGAVDLRAKAESTSGQVPANTISADAAARSDRTSVAMNEAVTAKPAPPSLQSFAKDARSRPEAPSQVSGEARRPARDELLDEETRADKSKPSNAEIANAPASNSSSGPVRESASAAAVAVGGALAGAPEPSAMAQGGRGATHVAVESPDHSVVWMLGARGAILRYSRAAGWILQASGVRADLIAGSAPSASICWVVGRVGTILRTRDGHHWSKIKAPVGGDLSSVIAVNATHATVSAADGRRFATSDGGATWRRL